MENKNYRLVFFIAFVLLGIVASMQFRSTWSRNLQDSAAKLQIEQLKSMLNEEREAVNKLKDAVTENEKLRDDYLNNAIKNADNDFLKWQHNYLNEVKLKAGLIDVKGSGIIIKLDDAPARINYPTWLLIIHDSDIKKVVNDLKKAGAQAISINGERLVATSEQVCAGPTIMINKNKYPVPYTIKAIGNADTLNKMVDESDSIQNMRRDGIRISMEKSKEVIITKYAHDLDKLIVDMEVAEK